MDEQKHSWAHPLLAEMWTLVSMPDWVDGKPILRANDIDHLGQAIQALNNDLRRQPMGSTDVGAKPLTNNQKV